MIRSGPLRRAGSLLGAVAAPGALSVALTLLNPGNSRDYVFLYLGVVAVVGLTSGLEAALACGAVSFVCVDFLLVRPVHTLEFADATDLINLIVFLGASGLVGTLGSRRRTAQLRAEGLARDLQLANIELGRLAETERQVSALEETDRLRREVLANVSHELRTPLASILTGATSLQRKSEAAHDARDEVDSLVVEARRLDRLVSSLIEMTRIEGGIVEARADELDIAEAATAAANRLRQENPQRGVEVVIGPDTPEVIADWHRLGQILDNLLENADHIAPTGTPIQITASGDENGHVIVRVVDQGPGIDAELRERIFERFVRGTDDPTGRRPGLGLGLAIVRGLVDAQGGRVWIEDFVEGQGASFAFTLPAADVEFAG